jgi:asparagine synthase (glutamine-hydrolysing)
MTAVIRYRGPDHSDVWLDPLTEVALGHNRLAIVDLSQAGNQPMASQSGRYVIVYNGEIYNHASIRANLIGSGPEIAWRGHSDTETLLAAIEKWGVRGALEQASGMFAFALWDRAERTLTLARDRLGEKPLYYGRGPGGGPFLFASELKAIATHPEFEPQVDRGSVALLLRYNNIPAPFSIYRGISKLMPGTFLTLRPGGSDPQIEEYWSVAAAAESGIANPVQGSADEIVTRFGELMEQSVGQQMLADVPLGAFLSGGVDSSTVVAVMQKLSERPVKTFTIGFYEPGYNEAEHARAVARHLGTDHTELYVTAAQARDVIPRLPEIYDEPFADPSQIPTYLVSQLARQHVTVALSGDGGDELFGGYNRYLLSGTLWRRISRIPMPVRAAAARAIATVSPSGWDRMARAAGGFLPKLARAQQLGDKMHKGAGLLRCGSDAALYGSMISCWAHPEDVVAGAVEPRSQATGDTLPLRGLGSIERMMALDMTGYLPNDILVKVDRAAMAVSLETRVPFLDRDIVEFAWKVPFEYKIRGGRTKWIMRELLDRYVPASLIDRPKMGFGVPIDSWLRGPLRDWAESLLGEQRLREEGYFRADPVREMWQNHLSRRTNEQYRLWIVLMFQSWLEAQGRPEDISELAPVAALGC